ncbi:MAG: DUF4340 domain-containing protein [Bacteroidia bacterium]
MLNKLNNKLLLLILVVLAAIYGIASYIQHKKGENTFHTNIIPKIDSNKVTTFYIYPKLNKKKPIRFDLKGKTWFVSSEGITSRADKKSENYIIQLIEGISPDHLATNDPAQWKDFDVTDSSGTRVVLLNNTDTLIDLLVGRFSYNNQLRKAMSCVRLHNQNDVYSVDGFLTMNVANEFVSWRDRALLTGAPEAWTKLTFTYPGDSSFTATHDLMSGWKVDGEKPDSITTVHLLLKLSQQNYGAFDDKFDTNKAQALYSLKVEGTNVPAFILKAYPADSANQYVITSSLNPGAYMSGKNQGMFNNIFLSKAAFFRAEAPRPAPGKPKMPKGKGRK